MSHARRASVLAGAMLLSTVLAGVASADERAPDAEHASSDTPASARLWSGGSALTIPGGRIEFGLFTPVHWGVTDDVELAAHPVLEIVLPHIEGKIRWLHRGAISLSTWHRLSYPTLLLETVSREGTLGLLPANTDVPAAIGLDTSFLVTVSSPGDRTHVTLELGLSLAPRLGGGDEVVLDFPFLYSRFAAVSTNGSTFAGLAATTVLTRNFSVAADVRLTTVSVVPHGFVLEHGVSIAWYPSSGFGLALGYRLAHGRYPVGPRTHFLPTIDVVFGFD